MALRTLPKVHRCAVCGTKYKRRKEHTVLDCHKLADTDVRRCQEAVVAAVLRRGYALERVHVEQARSGKRVALARRKAREKKAKGGR